jgi:hypothetical protein
MVYLDSGSISSMDKAWSTVLSVGVPRSVRYLRLPQQRAELEATTAQGLRVVPLHGALDRQHGAMSAEALAWQAQESGTWSDQPEPIWFRGRYTEDRSSNSGNSDYSSSSDDSSDWQAGVGGQQQEGQKEEGAAVLVMASAAAGAAAAGQAPEGVVVAVQGAAG